MEIIDKIGSGAFGAVYEAVVNGERRAAKKSYDDSIDYETAQLNRVNHINIVSAFGILFHDNVFYLIMEYMEGGSMKDLLRSRHFKLKDVINWFGQVAAGLAYLHAMIPQPMLHRDIKPQNILLSGDLQVVKIGDFGLSRDLASTMSNCKGTALYMAPEVFKSRKYTEKCDVYSFGISLWEMLTRKRPFAEYVTAEEILMAVAQRGERPSFEGLRCHNKLIDLIRFCWHKDPTVRPVMQIVFKVLRNTFKLYKQFEMSTDLLAGNVVEHVDEQKVLSAEHYVRDFMINVQRKNNEMDTYFYDKRRWWLSTVLRDRYIGIVDDSKYNGEIYEDQWNSIKNAVNRMDVEILYAQEGPIRTTMGLLRNSVELIFFKNKRSLKLYKNAIAEIGEVYPGAQLRVIDAEDLRLWTEATALLPNEHSDPKDILRIMGKSNPHEPIDNWKVLEIEECGQSQIQVIFQLDNKWKDENCILNYGLNKVRLSVIQFQDDWLKSCPDEVLVTMMDDTEEAKEVKPNFLRKMLDYFDID